jgi:hypothetical protein
MSEEGLLLPIAIKNRKKRVAPGIKRAAPLPLLFGKLIQNYYKRPDRIFRPKTTLIPPMAAQAIMHIL